MYLIQHRDVITPGFTVGCSSKNTLDACAKCIVNKTGIVYLHIHEVTNPFDVKQKLIEKFNKRVASTAVTDYFVGDTETIKDVFIETIQSEKNQRLFD